MADFFFVFITIKYNYLDKKITLALQTSLKHKFLLEYHIIQISFKNSFENKLIRLWRASRNDMLNIYVLIGFKSLHLHQRNSIPISIRIIRINAIQSLRELNIPNCLLKSWIHHETHNFPTCFVVVNSDHSPNSIYK